MRVTGCTLNPARRLAVRALLNRRFVSPIRHFLSPTGRFVDPARRTPARGSRTPRRAGAGPQVEVGAARGAQAPAPVSTPRRDRHREDQVLADNLRQIDRLVTSDGDHEILRPKRGLAPGGNDRGGGAGKLLLHRNLEWLPERLEAGAAHQGAGRVAAP